MDYADVVGGGDGRRSPDINCGRGGCGGGRTARRINRRSGDGGGAGGGGGGRRERHINRWREQEWVTTLAIHAVYVAANGLLYMLIQIKYQNQSNSPFDTHVAMTSSVVAFCIYLCATALQTLSVVAFCIYLCATALQTLLVQTNNKLDNAGLLNHILVCSGILSALSNILVFLPDMIGWIVIVPFVFATTILLVYDMFKLISNCISERNNRNNNNVSPTSEAVALEMGNGRNDNAATTSESLEISIDNNNERNNNHAFEMRTRNNFTGSTHTPFHSFRNQGFGD